MKTLIINNNTKHLAELQNIFLDSFVVAREDIANINVAEFDLIVISGGSHVPTVVNHNEIYIEEEKLIQLGKPVIGICLGCEIICRTFGGEVAFMDHKEQGEKEFTIIDKSLLEKLNNWKIKFFEAHSVHIAKVPKDFEILINSDHGPEMIKHNILPIIGIQFHPEVNPHQLLWEWIFEQLGF